jgi:hypothetical protein
VELAPLLDERQQGSSHRLQVASVLGAQLPQTAGIDVEVLYRYLDFGCPAWECCIEALGGLRQ